MATRTLTLTRAQVRAALARAHQDGVNHAYEATEGDVRIARDAQHARTESIRLNLEMLADQAESSSGDEQDDEDEQDDDSDAIEDES